MHLRRQHCAETPLHSLPATALPPEASKGRAPCHVSPVTHRSASMFWRQTKSGGRLYLYPGTAAVIDAHDRRTCLHGRGPQAALVRPCYRDAHCPALPAKSRVHCAAVATHRHSPVHESADLQRVRLGEAAAKYREVLAATLALQTLSYSCHNPARVWAACMAGMERSAGPTRMHRLGAQRSCLCR